MVLLPRLLYAARYGGSVRMKSTLRSGRVCITSMQSPWMIVLRAGLISHRLSPDEGAVERPDGLCKITLAPLGDDKLGGSPGARRGCHRPMERGCTCTSRQVSRQRPHRAKGGAI